MVDRQGSAALPTTDSAGHEQTGEVVTLRTGNEGPQATQAQWLLEALVGGKCANQAAPQRASDTGLLRLVPPSLPRHGQCDLILPQHVPEAQDPGFLHHCRLGQCAKATGRVSSLQEECHSAGSG